MTATVIAPTIWQAEAAAKVVLILGSTAGMRWLEERPELAGLVIGEDGGLIYSKRLKPYRWSAA